MRSRDRLRQTLESAAREVQRSVRTGPRGRVNVAARKNIKVASNSGRDGGTAYASSTQVTPIHQGGATDTD